MSKVVYGRNIFGQNPKTWTSVFETHLLNKLHIFNINKISIIWAKKGPNNSGTRYFRYDKVPLIKFWNPDIEFYEKKVPIGDPKIILDYVNGNKKEITTTNMKAEEILQTIISNTGSYDENTYLELQQKMSNQEQTTQEQTNQET